MKILHPFAIPKDKSRLKSQVPTWLALAKIRKKYTVIDHECKGLYGYDDFLKSHWQTEDFIVIEQDIVPTLEQIDELASCKQNLVCCFDYDNFGLVLDENANAYVYLGCTKYTLEMQKQVDPSEWYRKGTWKNLDSRISGVIRVEHKMKNYVHHHRPALVVHTLGKERYRERAIQRYKEHLLETELRLAKKVKDMDEYKKIQDYKRIIKELEVLPV
ncbi:MAG: hypothetical protein ACYCQJ_15265 [Nitrososphaerales archaeon]